VRVVYVRVVYLHPLEDITVTHEFNSMVISATLGIAVINL